MSKLADSWPTVRQVIYSLLAALAGGAGLFGLITQEQGDQWLGYAASVLSGLGLILATVNVRKPSEAPAPLPSLPPVTLPPIPTVEQVTAHVQSEVDRVRAEIEAQLGKITKTGD